MPKILPVFIGMLAFLSCSSDDTVVLEPQEFLPSISETIEHQGYQREYVLHIPPTYDGTSAAPLVVVLHGGGGTSANVQNFTEMNPVSDRYGFMVVYPQGIGPTGSGFSWADGRGASADQMGIDDVGFLNKLVDSLTAEFNINTNQVYVCGFSNGGFMTQRLACESNVRFAAMASLGSTISVDLLNRCQPERSIPMLFILGDADPLVPYEGGTVAENPTPVAGMDELLNFWTTNNRCRIAQPMRTLPDSVADDNSTAKLFEFTDCHCDAKVELFRLVNGGHTWPGVELVSLESLLGETNEDIEASDRLWDFFKQFEKCQ